jgi:molecular chaperone GrpE
MKDDNTKPLDEEVIESDAPEVDDVVFEEEGETAKDTIKKLREKLKNAELAKMEYLESMQRMKADYVNAKKRDDESKIEMIRYANIHFAEELLPTLDSFEQAMGDKEKWESVSKEWRSGVEGIYQKVLGVFSKNNIIGFGEVGETFDPNLHHSIQVVETEDKAQDGTIAQVLQKGYKTGEKIIRPAMVAVYEVKVAS